MDFLMIHAAKCLQKHVKMSFLLPFSNFYIQDNNPIYKKLSVHFGAFDYIIIYIML